MASSSSMCGPTNALQQLKNHSARDRSLQQDRFRPSSSPQPSSQFRSHQPHLLAQPDLEFDQFLSSSPSASSSALQPVVAPPALHQQPWATDFQNLQISAPPPPAAVAAAAPIHATPALSGWGAEFLSQMAAAPAPIQSAPLRSQRSHGTLLPGPTASYSVGMNSAYLQTPSFQSMPSLQPQQQQPADSKQLNYTDAEFDMMFEEAAAAQAFDGGVIMDFPQREVPQPLLETDVSHIAEELPQEEVAEDKRDPDHDADELARTAGQLVDTLSQDTSRKFQESQFVALMRKLRDKTVKVEDGKMVEMRLDESHIPYSAADSGAETRRGDVDAGRFAPV
ncbi:hypothetical protein Dda_5100 [Drechslerella dactyloides]|uniref:Peroxin 20 n=1 Tax=Drechslerella dactyloides TaxID=74499 RepID=A0AAD6NJW7_DREDA|nr:hypothetical protein Dda_5100 [Drechslerella dactyloides]